MYDVIAGPFWWWGWERKICVALSGAGAEV